MSKRRFVGIITAAKMTNTVRVAVDIPKKHPIYEKSIKWTSSFLAMNEVKAKLGDTVAIEESSPYSKKVAWKVVEILEGKEDKK